MKMDLHSYVVCRNYTLSRNCKICNRWRWNVQNFHSWHIFSTPRTWILDDANPSFWSWKLL